MNRSDGRVIVGLLLVAVGTLLLLQNLGLLGITWNALWAVLFLAGGVAFLSMFVSNPSRWWPLIPAFTLLGLGALMVLQTVAPRAAAVWGGPIFLGSMGLAFLAVYLAQRENWWAIIPGGVLFTLAVVAGVSGYGGGAGEGTILFLGLATTFGLVYLALGPRRPRNWALVTAVALLALALITAAAAVGIVSYLWPLILILLGAYLLYRSLRSRRES